MDDPRDPPPPPVEVPHELLSPEALRAVVESFVLREGTDYGRHEVAFEVKVAQVLRQLEHGDAQVVYDPASETVGIVPTVRRGRPRPGEE